MYPNVLQVSKIIKTLAKVRKFMQCVCVCVCLDPQMEHKEEVLEIFFFLIYFPLPPLTLEAKNNQPHEISAKNKSRKKIWKVLFASKFFD